MELAEEIGNLVRIVREVCIHLEHNIVPVGKRIAKPGHVRRAKAHFLCAFHHVNERILLRCTPGKRTGPVGGTVVDNKDLDPFGLAQHFREEPQDVLRFVVCRDDDENSRHVALSFMVVVWSEAARSGMPGAPLIGTADRLHGLSPCIEFPDRPGHNRLLFFRQFGMDGKGNDL